MGIYVQNNGISQEESFGMGDEGPLDVSVAVDPYYTHSYVI
jgi:hypothetical protein